MDKLLSIKQVGNLGEDLIAKFLKDKGYRILERNFRTPFGEIDIVVEKKGVVSIVEVKTRLLDHRKTSISVYNPEDNITAQKQRKLIKLGNFYIASHKKYKEAPWEINVAAVEIAEGQKPNIRFLKQAVVDE